MSRISLLICSLLIGFPVLAQTSPANSQHEAPPPQGLQTPQPNISLLPLDTSTPEELETQGDELRARNMYLDAVDSYRAAIAKKPSAELYNKLAICYIQQRRTHEAHAALSRAIHLNHTYAEAWNNQGSAYYLDGDFRRASKEFEHAIKLSNDNASFHGNLGSAFFNEHQLVKASREYEIALKLDPYVFERSSKTGISASMGKPADHAEFEYIMAKLFAQANDPANALIHLQKAIEEGYKNINNFYKDAEFATVRKDERFVSLMAQKPEGIPQQP